MSSIITNLSSSYAIDGTINNTIDGTINNTIDVGTITRSKVNGNINDRFKEYKSEFIKWTNSSQYYHEIVSNGNNIQYVLNPTKEDYLLAIEHGARPEFIDMNIITLEVLEDFIKNNASKFI